jgi:hypothetical protein
VPQAADDGLDDTTTREDLDMRPFHLRRRSRASACAPARSSEQVLQEILSGPDTAHRRELEILLEERDS